MAAKECHSALLKLIISENRVFHVLTASLSHLTIEKKGPENCCSEGCQGSENLLAEPSSSCQLRILVGVSGSLSHLRKVVLPYTKHHDGKD